MSCLEKDGLHKAKFFLIVCVSSDNIYSGMVLLR